jgi:peptidoglycan hydrolase CwlO-like protein
MQKISKQVPSRDDQIDKLTEDMNALSDAIKKIENRLDKLEQKITPTKYSIPSRLP